MKGEVDLKEKKSEAAEEEQPDPYHHHAKYPKQINSSYLKVRYECDVIHDPEEEEEEETKAETKDKITLGINVEILACEDETNCVDFSLKEYKINGVIQDIRIDARDYFLRHIQSVMNYEPIKNYVESLEQK